MALSYDAVVIGLGAMGSAAADALARRGRRVLGLDRFAPPHDRGSSHGRSRVIREAYFEHPLYVPLVRRAYELWHELEEDEGVSLYTRTGLVSIGPPEGTVVAGALRSAREHGILHAELGRDEIRARWPLMTPPEGTGGLYEAGAGLLAVERCIEALMARARAHGAVLRTGQPVLGWSASADAVEVRTATGTHSAGALVVSAGAWAASLLPDLALPLSVERRLVHWFAPAREAEALRADHCPIVLWEYAPDRLFYTTPDTGAGVKAALHNEGEPTDPDAVRPPAEGEADRAHTLLERILPAAAGALRETVTCLYTNTPDGHFLVDRHPAHRQVIIASPCSGHGFKFAPAIGEALADLVTEGTSPFDLQPFALRP